MRKIIYGLAICLACCLSIGSVAAADTITYLGDAGDFISLEGGAIDFTTMFPGETRTATFDLVNDSGNEVRFYVASEILDNIAQKGDGTAVYEFTIKDGSKDIFQAVIGNNQVTIGAQFLVSNNNIMLGELMPGESKTVSFNIYLDGDSTNNDYQGQTGEIAIIFSVEQVLPDAPSTGDDSISPIIYGGLIIVAIGVLVVIRKGGNSEK